MSPHTPSSRFALNHVTVPHLAWRDLVRLAVDLGCDGVEFRGDLGRDMFDGDSAQTVRSFCKNHAIRILALAEVSQFNSGNDSVLQSARDLAIRASDVGAEAVILIPQVGGREISFDQTCTALDHIGSILAEHDMRGLVEPIGFEGSTLRSFDRTRDAIRETHGTARFGLVHDTFHHHVSGEEAVRGDMVELIHVSGVSASKTASAMTDEDRHLVAQNDRLGTIEQLKALIIDGAQAPISVEAFSPQTQADPAPKGALSVSIDFISGCLGVQSAPLQTECRTALTGAPV